MIQHIIQYIYYSTESFFEIAKLHFPVDFLYSKEAFWLYVSLWKIRGDLQLYALI